MRGRYCALLVSLLLSLLTSRALAQTSGPVCGNGRIEPGEQCDDGNVAGGDGCAADCQVEQQCYDAGSSFSFFVWSDSYSGGGESGVERVFTDATNRSRYPDRVIPRFWVAAGDVPFMVDGSQALDGLNDTISNSTSGQHYPFTCAASNGKFPYFVAVGNHDVGGEGNLSPAQQYDYWSNYVGPRLPTTLVGISNFRWGPAGTQDARTTYSFDYKGGHFIVLNQYHGDPSYPTSDPVACIRNDLMQWIDEDLAQTTKPMRFVFGHEPAWSYCSNVPGSGGSYCPVGSIDNQSPAYRPRPHSTTGDWLEPFGNHWGDSLEDSRCPSGSRAAFWSLLARHDVIAVFNGHTHTYSGRLVEGNGTRRNDVPAYDKGGLFQSREGVWGIEAGTTHNSAGAAYVLATVNESSVVFESYDQMGMTEPFKLIETWTVAASQAPQVAIVSPAAGATFASDAPVTVEASASDLDGTVAQVAFYAGSTLVGTDTTSPYSVTWTNAPAGQYALTAVATDDAGLSKTSAAVGITVNPSSSNAAPVLSVNPSQTASEGTALAFVASATDADGDALTFSLVGAPAGAGIDPVSGAFAWTPGEAQGPGSYTFTVRVTDGGAPTQSADQAVTVTVSEINLPPALGTVASFALNEGAALALTLAATDADLPANTLTYALVSGPAGMAVNATNGAVTWTPTEAQGPGTYAVTVRVTDGGSPSLSATASFSVGVNEVNQAPVLASIGSKTVAEGTLLTFKATATDADLPANILTYGLVGAPAGATIDPTSGVFTWTPGPADAGSKTFTVTVTDSGTPALSHQRSVTVTVTGRPDLTLSALSTKTTIVGLGRTLSASSTVANPGASKAGASAVYFSLSPDAAFGGTGDVPFATVRSVASLAAGATSAGSVTLTVPAATPLGSYFLCGWADGANAVTETSETNNGRCTATAIQVGAPDLRVSSVAPSSSTATRGGQLRVSNTVANDGAVSAAAFSVAFVLSTDAAWSGDDLAFGQRSVSSLGAAAASSATSRLTVPSSTPLGFYYVCALADSGASVAESNEANNTACSSTRVEIR